ncbi:hypothetical protein TDMWS_16790 [Thermodesulfomicrobium sp. WS]|uniref:hypothetical protein n=1 Tax=Thermodesulfomicrobium sp. WS TaxID=3004129 RepID=UPI0024929A44|nr:hypothetical protein [Thermodesulfomicrobium sp. WS]BDV01594.1 hypothetical protein TDMWS_16790 [Thermodesulfomicrobium sp. WS]
MNTRPTPSSKAKVCLAALLLALTAAPWALAQGIVMESTPQAETQGFFDQRTILFTDNATEEFIRVTPQAPRQERSILLAPELHLDLEVQPPAPRPPRVLLPATE